MSVEDRPYIGTFRLNNKKVIRHTPDTLVYFNGDTAIPGCPNCNGRIDLQEYITAVSVDPSTEGPATASVSMHVPRSTSHSLWRDGNFLLRPGIEVSIYLRGYFPVQGALADASSEDILGLDPTKAVVFPYYHVFHGVVTEVAHEYSGGDHTVSISCADLLHFWQYIRMSTNASALGSRPSNSKNRMSFVGHNFTGMTPYGIVYSLWRDLSGAAGGVAFALSNQSNNSAHSTALDQSLYSMTQLYWQKRFSQGMGSLRMYGLDGTLFNAFQQAFLAKLSTKEFQNILSAKFTDKAAQDRKQFDPLVVMAELLGLTGGNNLGAYVLGAGDSEKGVAEGELGVSMAQMQAFTFDVSQAGNVNLWESEYQTKAEIMSTLVTLTGYEWYMDVDGDFVFKPPYYNLDTSSSRVYVIKPIDIISFSAKEGEPEATVVKATSPMGRNIRGIGLENEMGQRAEYIDYRLVAQFGWRPQTFETEYYNSSRAMYFACVNRLDLFNINVNSASCQIPLRPELRPGYPVYIEHLDCFYYLSAFNHSFSYGGQCTTSLTLNAKRAKFHAPGLPPLDRRANIDDIDLSNPFLPKLPLLVEGNDELPRIQGFPNAVLALDPEALNPLFYIVGRNFSFGGNSSKAKEKEDPEQQLRQLILAALNAPVPILTRVEEESDNSDEQQKFFEGPFALQKGNGEYSQLRLSELLSQFTPIQEARQEVENLLSSKNPDPAAITAAEQKVQELTSEETDLNILITAVQSSLGDNFSDGESTAAYLDLLSDLKASFAPGKALPGYYRYYSASHPDPEQQGQAGLNPDEENGTEAGDLTLLEEPDSVLGFARTSAGGVEISERVEVRAGLPIMRPGTSTAEPTPTHKIQTISFARHVLTTTQVKYGRSGSRALSFAEDVTRKATQREFEALLADLPLDETTEVSAIFEDMYNTRADALSEIASGSFENDEGLGLSTGDTADIFRTFEQALEKLPVSLPRTPDALLGGPTGNRSLANPNAVQISRHLSKCLAQQASRLFRIKESSLNDTYGSRGQPSALVDRKASKEAKEAASAEKEEVFCRLEILWDQTRQQLAPNQAQVSVSGRDIKTAVPFDREKEFYSPVFPVSDERGYEVIGSYRYGRGLSIEPGGSFEQLANIEEISQVQALGFDEVDAGTVEELLLSLQNPGDLAKTLGSLDPEEKAKLAEAVGIEASTDLSTLLTPDNPDGNLFENLFAARAANSNQSTQKTTVINSAYALADLGQTISNNICECRGAESDVLLLAFNPDNFIDFGLPDDVGNFLATNAANAAVPWESSQQALRGQTLSTNDIGLAQAFNNVVDEFTSARAQSVNIINTALGDLDAAGAQLQQDINDFNDGG